jgi:hypothetical protein
MNLIDYTADLEIIVKYGGIELLTGFKKDVKADHLIHAIDSVNGLIVKDMETMIGKIIRSGDIEKWNTDFKKYTDKTYEGKI